MVRKCEGAAGVDEGGGAEDVISDVINSDVTLTDEGGSAEDEPVKDATHGPKINPSPVVIVLLEHLGPVSVTGVGWGVRFVVVRVPSNTSGQVELRVNGV